MSVNDKSRGRPTAASVDKTLTKGLQLLEALSKSEGPRGVSELAIEMALTKSNIHRLMQTLVAAGYVRRDDETERYLLSSKLWCMARLGQPFQALRDSSRPTLRSAVAKTSDSVLFAVLEGDELLIVDQVETQNVVRVYFALGQTFRLDEPVATGTGLTALQMVALAYRSPGQKAAKLNGTRSVAKGVSDVRLAQIRKDGFATTRGSWLKDVNAVVVPVFDSQKNFTGVLSCFGPATRLTENRFSTVVKILSESAIELGKRLV